MSTELCPVCDVQSTQEILAINFICSETLESDVCPFQLH